VIMAYSLMHHPGSPLVVIGPKEGESKEPFYQRSKRLKSYWSTSD
jgi:hypothetical protein